MATALDVAAYIVKRFAADVHENDLTQLKLQKLLYYAQGYELADTGKPLFDDAIEAWEYGPVVPNVYNAFAEEEMTGRGVIFECPGGDPDAVPEEARELLDDVLNVRGQFSAGSLVRMTHKEAPWKDAYQAKKRNVIPQDALAKYFEGYLADE